MVEDRWSQPHWLLWLCAALALHLLLFVARPVWDLHEAPKRVEIGRLDPGQLEKLREQWKDQAREKALLLSKDKTKPEEAPKPKNARYMSDRNRNVEKEQRAKNTQVLPRPGAPSQKQSDSQKQASRETKKPQLAKLGVPMHLNEPSHQAQAGQSGGDQAIVDHDLPQGSENLLNTEESIYYSFYARLYESIAPLWQNEIRAVQYRRKVPAGDYVSLADVVFNSEGDLVEVHLKQSSGIPEFDEAIQKAWKRVGRFPNPPKDLLDAQGRIHTGWTFTVQLSATDGMQYLPPERAY